MINTSLQEYKYICSHYASMTWQLYPKVRGIMVENEPNIYIADKSINFSEMFVSAYLLGQFFSPM